MKVTVSVFGRFHAFYLADQLHKRGHLSRLITSYPGYEVKKYGIPREKTSSLLLHELARRGWSSLNQYLKWPMSPDQLLGEAFDLNAYHFIPKDTTLYVGWSGFSERGLQAAKKYGAMTIVERGSAHIETQAELLREEYDTFGSNGEIPHPQVIEKEKREYSHADYISVPSAFAYRSFVERGISPNKLIQSVYGVDLKAFWQLPKHDDVFRVIYAGNMSLRKGVHYLLRAFAELKLTNAELWLLGGFSSEIEPFFNAFNGTFKYLGKVPQTMLHQYYSQGSVFVICSIEEGLAMVQPQAMACGLPLICTTNTGGEDLIDNGKEGFIIPIRSVEALKEKLLYLYEHMEYAQVMGQAAKQKVQNGLTWSDYGDRITSIYQSKLHCAHS